MVAEVASNDGYLLQYFVQRGMPVLGVDPAANCAEAAERERGCRRRSPSSGRRPRPVSAQGFAADLMAANNVLAQVPDINDFVAGFKILLKPDGVVTSSSPICCG